MKIAKRQTGGKGCYGEGNKRTRHSGLWIDTTTAWSGATRLAEIQGCAQCRLRVRSAAYPLSRSPTRFPFEEQNVLCKLMRERACQVGVLAVGAACAVAAFVAVANVQDTRLSVLEVVMRPAPRSQLVRFGNQWPAPAPAGASEDLGNGKDEFADSWDAYEDLMGTSASGGGYGFEPELPLGGVVGDEIGSLYSPDSCIPQTYSELPPGYICTLPTKGVFALDPYGNLYGRRVQWKLRRIVASEEAVAKNAAQHAPNLGVRQHHFHWVSPMDWLEPMLLPNASVCQELVMGWYDAISSPMSADLVNATAFIDDHRFVYSGSDVALVPGCVADVPAGYKVVGAEPWASAFAKTVAAFGKTTSELVGNVSCAPQRNQANRLQPTMVCVAHHDCMFELRNVANASGLPVSLQGPILDTFAINADGKIVALKSEFDPEHFVVAGRNTTKASNDDAKASMAA